MTIIRDILYSSTDPASQVLDLYLPDAPSADLLIYFHGGGLESGSKECEFLEYFPNHGKAVISANSTPSLDS